MNFLTPRVTPSSGPQIQKVISLLFPLPKKLEDLGNNLRLDKILFQRKTYKSTSRSLHKMELKVAYFGVKSF